MAASLAVASHCPYCALQCGMSITVGEDRPIQVEPRQFPTNGGGMCQKGWTSASLLTTPDRLTEPLVRDARGRLVPVGWDVALDRIAAALIRTQAAHGSDAVAVFGGGGLTNEKAYALGKFARAVLRTSRIDYNGRFCMSSAAAAANASLGLDRGLPFPLVDLGGADAVLLLGSNLAETMPPAVQHLAEVRRKGGLVVVDPRRSATASLTGDPVAGVDGGGRGTDGAHLQPLPGTDLALLLGLIHVVLIDGLADAEYLASRTRGAEELRRSVVSWWPERVATVTGVPANAIRRTARLLAAAAPVHGGRGAYILTGRGVEQSVQGTATVTAAINLALVLGLVGRVGSGYGAITGQGNGQGGREHGQKSDQLPGYRSISDAAARAHVAGVWGIDPDDLPGPGVPAVQLLRELGTPTGPRALLVHGSNLLVSAPASGSLADRLRALDLLVVCDVVPSETAQLADVVLPVTQWAEEEGTMTSLEGRVIRRRLAVEPPSEVRSELWVLAELAARLGSPVRFDTDAATVFDELARASAGGRADYAGLSHRRLDDDEAASGPGFFWPVPDPDHPGTPRMFLDSFPTPDGRARLVAVEHHGPDEAVRDDAPIHLVTGRVLQHYQSGAQTRRVAELSSAVPEAFVEIHPVLALRLGVQDGDLVRLTSSRGWVQGRARWTDRIRPDTVFMPFHFTGLGSVNRVTNDATDPISGMPEFKVCAVEVARAVEVATADREEVRA